MFTDACRVALSLSHYSGSSGSKGGDDTWYFTGHDDGSSSFSIFGGGSGLYGFFGCRMESHPTTATAAMA
jgi:hypothetical protein